MKFSPQHLQRTTAPPILLWTFSMHHVDYVVFPVSSPLKFCCPKKYFRHISGTSIQIQIQIRIQLNSTLFWKRSIIVSLFSVVFFFISSFFLPRFHFLCHTLTIYNTIPPFTCLPSTIERNLSEENIAQWGTFRPRMTSFWQLVRLGFVWDKVLKSWENNESKLQ